jgi:hypothetical protein
MSLTSLVPSSGIVTDALSMCTPDIVSSTVVSVRGPTDERALAFNSMKGFSTNASVLTSQSNAFLSAPGYPRAYSGSTR